MTFSEFSLQQHTYNLPPIVKFIKTLRIQMSQNSRSPDGMTMDFVPTEHRDDIELLMCACSISLKEAFQLYESSGHNVEVAINKKVNPLPEPSPNNPQIPSHLLNDSFVSGSSSRRPNGHRQHIEQFNGFDMGFPSGFFEEGQDVYSSSQRRGSNRGRGMPMRVEEEDGFDVKFNKYLEYKRTDSQKFYNRYKIKRQVTQSDPEEQSVAQKIFEKPKKKKEKKKQSTHVRYINILEKKLLKKRCYIKLNEGSISEAIESGYKNEQDVLVLHLKFDELSSPNEEKRDELKQEKRPKNDKLRKQKGKGEKKNRNFIDLTGEQPLSNASVSMPSSGSLKQTEELDESSEKNQFLKHMLLSDRMKDYLRHAFINCIYNVSCYQLESYLEQYFPESLQKQSYLNIFRVNAFDEIELISRINIDEVFSELGSLGDQSTSGHLADSSRVNEYERIVRNIVDKLKEVKSKCIKLSQEDAHLKKRLESERRGYSYHKPLTISEEKKIKEDRRLKSEQQQEFRLLEEQILEQKYEEAKRLEEQSMQKYPCEITESGRKVPKKLRSREQILQGRRQLRQKLKIYENTDEPDLVMVKVRVPSGKSIIVVVHKDEKIQYLFDYVKSLENQNIGFEQEEEFFAALQEKEESELESKVNGARVPAYCQRDFDLIWPYKDQMSLQEKRQETLEVVFEGSNMESLSVKEQ